MEYATANTPRLDGIGHFLRHQFTYRSDDYHYHTAVNIARCVEVTSSNKMPSPARDEAGSIR